MIVSHKKKFVFIHIPRTGGTSIRKCIGHFNEIPIWLHKSKLGKQTDQRLEKHVKAHTLFSVIGSYNDYFKFGFVRNPWDWMLSIYLLIKKDKADPRNKMANQVNFKEFVKIFYEYDPKVYPARDGQYSYLYSSNRQLVDFIGRFERLKQDFEKVCSKIGITANLPRINSTTHDHYRNYYDRYSRLLVAEMFSKDIEVFRYKF